MFILFLMSHHRTRLFVNYTLQYNTHCIVSYFNMMHAVQTSLLYIRHFKFFKISKSLAKIYYNTKPDPRGTKWRLYSDCSFNLSTAPAFTSQLFGGKMFSDFVTVPWENGDLWYRNSSAVGFRESYFQKLLHFCCFWTIVSLCLL